MQILIIEDEPKAAKDLQYMLESIPMSIEVVGRLDSVADSINWFRKHRQPDLIFADIQLLDGLCFEIFQECSLTAPVIFCTAYDEYALTAFAYNGIDYLLKPIDQNRLLDSILKFYRIINSFNNSISSYVRRVQTVGQQLTNTYSQTLIAFFRNKLVPVQINSIRYMYLRHGITQVRTLDHTFALNQPLDHIYLQLDPLTFYRANRTIIIHRDSITSVESLPARKLGVILFPDLDELIIISKAKATNFMRWFNKSSKPIL